MRPCQAGNDWLPADALLAAIFQAAIEWPPFDSCVRISLPDNVKPMPHSAYRIGNRLPRGSWIVRPSRADKKYPGGCKSVTGPASTY